jgi:hypothetical protein
MGEMVDINTANAYAVRLSALTNLQCSWQVVSFQPRRGQESREFVSGLALVPPTHFYMLQADKGVCFCTCLGDTAFHVH